MVFLYAACKFYENAASATPVYKKNRRMSVHNKVPTELLDQAGDSKNAGGIVTAVKNNGMHGAFNTSYAAGSLDDAIPSKANRCMQNPTATISAGKRQFVNGLTRRMSFFTDIAAHPFFDKTRSER